MYAVSEDLSHKLIVGYDDFPYGVNPRNYDNLGTLICFHRKYHLGDKNKFHSMIDFLHSLLEDIYKTDLRLENALSKCASIKDMTELISKNYVIVPVYLLDHSGLWMQTYPFIGHEFDSGLLGFIYASHDDIRKSFSIKKLTHKYIEKAKHQLVTEIQEYSDYISGNVFYYRLIDKSKCHEIDSCYGIIAGSLQEIKETLTPLISREHKELINNLAFYEADSVKGKMAII